MQTDVSRLMQEYDRGLAAERDKERVRYYRSSRGKFQRMAEVLESKPYDSILEIGPSEFLGLVKWMHPQVRAASVGLQEYQPAWKDVDIHNRCGDVLAPSLPYADGEFDVILFSEVLEHLQGNAHQAFAEFHRILRPGGRLILTTPNLARLYNRVKLLLGLTPLERIERSSWGGHFREYTMAEVCDFFRRTGFAILYREHSLYWDGVSYNLENSVVPIPHPDGVYDFRLRFSGWKRWLALPPLLVVDLLTRYIPTLRNGMLVVGGRT